MLVSRSLETNNGAARLGVGRCSALQRSGKFLLQSVEASLKHIAAHACSLLFCAVDCHLELIEWMPPPDGIAMCQSDVRENVTQRREHP